MAKDTHVMVFAEEACRVATTDGHVFIVDADGCEIPKQYVALAVSLGCYVEKASDKPKKA